MISVKKVEQEFSWPVHFEAGHWEVCAGIQQQLTSIRRRGKCCVWKEEIEMCKAMPDKAAMDFS